MRAAGMMAFANGSRTLGGKWRLSALTCLGVLALLSLEAMGDPYVQTSEIQMKSRDAKPTTPAINCIGEFFWAISEITVLRVNIWPDDGWSIREMNFHAGKGDIWGYDTLLNKPGKQPWIWESNPVEFDERYWVILEATVTTRGQGQGKAAPPGKRYSAVSEIDVDVDSRNSLSVYENGHRGPTPDNRYWAREESVEDSQTTQGEPDEDLIALGMVYGVNDDHETATGTWRRDSTDAAEVNWEADIVADKSLPKVKLTGNFVREGCAGLSAQYTRAEDDYAGHYRLWYKDASTFNDKAGIEFVHTKPLVGQYAGFERWMYLELKPVLSTAAHTPVPWDIEYLRAMWLGKVKGNDDHYHDRPGAFDFAKTVAVRVDLDVDSDNDGVISVGEETDNGTPEPRRYEDLNEAKPSLAGMNVPLGAANRKDAVVRCLRLTDELYALLVDQQCCMTLFKSGGGGTVKVYKKAGGALLGQLDTIGPGSGISMIGAEPLLAAVKGDADLNLEIEGVEKGLVEIELEISFGTSGAAHRDRVRVTVTD